MQVLIKIEWMTKPEAITWAQHKTESGLILASHSHHIPLTISTVFFS